MNLILKKGAPESMEGRTAREARCYELLRELGVELARVDHPSEPADTMEACERIDAALGAVICKNLFLCNRQKTDFYLLMIPAGKIFKTKDLSAQIGSARLSFASGEQMVELLDTEPGSLSVLSLMNDKDGRVRLLVDRDLLSSEYIGCHPCVNTSSLRLSRDDIFNKIVKAVDHEPTYVTLPIYENDEK